MYCSNCGAFVNGKYCSCCGGRQRTPLEEFRCEENRRKRAFKRSVPHELPNQHIAEACWHAGATKYIRNEVGPRRYTLNPDAWDMLDEAEACAQRLYVELIKLLRVKGDPYHDRTFTNCPTSGGNL